MATSVTCESATMLRSLVFTAEAYGPGIVLIY